MYSSIDGAVVWFRRELRADDHAALHHALKVARRVWCVFVLDRDILDALPRADRRVEFILTGLSELHAELAAVGATAGVQGAGVIVRQGWAADEIAALAQSLHVTRWK